MLRLLSLLLLLTLSSQTYATEDFDWASISKIDWGAIPEIMQSTYTFGGVEYAEQVKPIYPAQLMRFGNHGIVRLKVILSGDASEILEISPVSSDHPLFEREAVRSMLKSRFKLVGGAPYPGPFSVIAPIRFTLSEPAGSLTGTSVKPYKFPPKSPSKLPQEFQYDQAPEIVSAVAPVYPFELLQNKVTGKATISAVVDPEGNIRRVTVLKSSHEAFGLATKAMMESWKLSAAKRNNEPIWTIFSMEKTFSLEDRDLDVSEQTKSMLQKLKAGENQFYQLNQLDNIPTARFHPSPVSPPSLQADAPRVASRKVMVKFILDEQGLVHLPHIVSADAPDVAWAALTAVARWQFTPPTVNNMPVQAILKLPIAFDAPEQAEANPAEELEQMPQTEQ